MWWKSEVSSAETSNSQMLRHGSKGAESPEEPLSPEHFNFWSGDFERTVFVCGEVFDKMNQYHNLLTRILLMFVKRIARN